MNREIRRHVSQGQALYEARSYEEAYHQFTLAIQLVEAAADDLFMGDQEVAELYLTRGAILAAEDEQLAVNDPDTFHLIMADYDMAIDNYPQQYYYRNLRGRMYLSCAFADFTEEAQADFAHVLEHDPADAGALKHMGQTFSKLKDYDTAIGFFTRSLETHVDTECYLHRALCYFKNSPPDFDAAAADFGRARKQLPRLEELYIWRAQCFQELGRIADAIAEYDRLLEINPGDAGYYVDRGALRNLLDQEGAREDFDRAIELGQHPLAFNNRAFYFLSLGKYNLATRDAKAALASDPKCHIAYATLAEIFARQNKRKEFYHYLSLALRDYYDDVIEVLETPAYAPFRNDKQFAELLGKTVPKGRVA